MNPLRRPAGRTVVRGDGQDPGTMNSGGATAAEAVIGHTQSICPRCRAVLDAELRVRDGRVVLSRSCPDHGSFEAVVYGDAARYLEIQRFNKAGAAPLERQTQTVDGCPHDCGICPEHVQHTCLGVIEVNTACNLDCPICFAESGRVKTATASP